MPTMRHIIKLVENDAVLGNLSYDQKKVIWTALQQFVDNSDPDQMDDRDVTTFAAERKIAQDLVAHFDSYFLA